MGYTLDHYDQDSIIIMGEARRRKTKDPNFGKARQKLTTGSFANPFNSLREYVEYHTAQKGRGYLACAENGCCYYGKDNYVGDEDELLLQSIQDYNPHSEAILVQQVISTEAFFSTSIVPLVELERPYT